MHRSRFDELDVSDFSNPSCQPHPIGTAYISEGSGTDPVRFTVTWQVMFNEWLVLYHQPANLVLSLEAATAWSRDRADEVYLQFRDGGRSRAI